MEDINDTIIPKGIITGVSKLEWVLLDGTVEQGMMCDPYGTFFYWVDKKVVKRSKHDMKSMRITWNPQSHKEIMETNGWCLCEAGSKGFFKTINPFDDCSPNN